jgi:hypothetical protein
VEAALSLAHCDRSLVKEVIPRFVWYSQARDFRVDACPKVERERERGWLASWLAVASWPTVAAASSSPLDPHHRCIWFTFSAENLEMRVS